MENALRKISNTLKLSLEEFNEDVFSKYDCMTLAEAPMVTPKKALKYIDVKLLDHVIIGNKEYYSLKIL